MGSFDYSHWRKAKMVCFACRKVFNEIPTKCPNCGGKVINLGTHFKAPKRSKLKEWEAVEMLAANGIGFEVYDWHFHGWSENYKANGKNFTEFQLGQVLLENGIGRRDYDPNQVWTRPFEYDWQGERPTHPHDVPAYVQQWRQKILERIAIVFEACDRLDVPRPKLPEDKVTLEEIEALLPIAKLAKSGTNSEKDEQTENTNSGVES